jgi:enoyl-CoA hydratase/carnithine racemase
MAEPVLLVETRERIATVTLHRPKSLNALSRALVAEITRTFAELQADAGVDVAILTGSGRAFCAGVDLKELSAADAAPQVPGDGPESAVRMIDAIAAFDRPLIGAINGVAITGGFELALMCDLRIAGPQARFADTHARVGIAPGWGLSQKLSRLIGIGRAKEVSFTGNFVDAATAERWGLVNRVVPEAELLPTCLALARDMQGCDPRTLRRYKRMIDEGYGLPFAEAMRMEWRESQEHMRGVTSQAVAERREAIQQRGRDQARGGNA